MAQPPQGKRGGGASLSGEIFGNVIDSLTNKPMGYVTILALKQPSNDMSGGTVSSDNGNFSIQKLTPGKYNLKISFVGYETKIIENIVISKENLTYQIKTLALVSRTLNTVEVIGDKPLVTYEIDKKVINVEDQITNTSQTALEVLANAPSVTVDVDGNVSLRGSTSFTLLIDGVPTAMDANDALATIPASTIKDIEIITNPSAKFDAEGTSGVINIVTKKNKLEGVSLLANVSAGTFQNYSGDIALNYKKNAFTFNVSGNYRQRSRPSENTETRTTTYDSLTNVLKSDGISDWSMNSKGVSGEVQWKPNNSHLFVVKSRVNNRLMVPESDLEYFSYDDSVLVQNFSNYSHNFIDIFNVSSSLFYQYNIKRNKDHNLSLKAVYNFVDVTQNDTATSYNEVNEILNSNIYTEIGPSTVFRLNLDYKLPLKKGRKFETGLQSQLGKSADEGKNFVYNTISKVYEINDLYSTSVDYTRNVYAGYAIFGGKTKSLGYQIGLRAEYTDRTVTSAGFEDFTKINRMDYFPSAHLSYSLQNKDQLLVSYSKRIQRPRSYYFEPFITWESPFNVRSGNADLIPEYINAFEISYIKPLKKKKGYLSLETYYRSVSNIIRRISTIYETGVLISRPYNIGKSQSIGIEPSINYNATDWWKINSAANVYLYLLDGSIEDIDYSTQSFNWNARLTNTFKVKGGFTFQLMSRYQSKSVSAQGESFGYFTQDASIKKSFAKNKFAFTLQGRNILNTQKRGSISTIQNVDIYSERIPLYPQISLTLSIKLNNYQKVYDRSEQMDDF